MANGERKKYLLDKIKGHFNDKCYILHNYPDKHFSDLPKKGLPLDISKWLQGEPYILAQGGASPKRYIEEIIDAVLQIRYVKLVVVGSFESQLLERKRAEYGELFDKEVFFTGLIPQMQVAVFIDHALASIVLYNSGDMNSFYCAPNRMYQAVIRGKPVITGCNPPMSNFVNTYNVGIALLSDGRDVKDILSGMKLLFHKVSGKEISEIDKSLILWENQDEIIYAIIR